VESGHPSGAKLKEAEHNALFLFYVRIDCHSARIPALGGSADDRYTSIFENR
jgi:hypothetical protein